MRTIIILCAHTYGFAIAQYILRLPHRAMSLLVALFLFFNSSSACLIQVQLLIVESSFEKALSQNAYRIVYIVRAR